MPEDRSLDEFAPAGDDAVDAVETADDDAAAEAPDAPDDGTAPDDEVAPDPDAVAPAEATYDVSPDGADCAVCGTTATRRWRDDAGYVCADCKEW